MSKARDLADLISAGNPLSDGAVSVAEISDLTASAAELNKLDGVTASTAELNQVVGATSALQTQLDNISVTSGSLTKTFTQNETADITLSQGITSAPVVSATKEIPQTGITTKGTWDVNSTASNYTIHNTAYSVTLTPNKSALTMTLGSGSWASTDVGKRVQGNGGDVVIASVSGSTATYFTDNGTDFTNNNAIASGSWSMEGLMSVDDATGLSVQKRSRTVTTTANVYGTTFRVASASASYNHQNDAQYAVGLHVARSGSHFYICKQSQGVKIYTMGSNFNVSGSSYVSSWNVNGLGNYDIELNDTGTKIYQYVGHNVVKQWSITGTAWRPDTGTGNNSNHTLTGNQTDSTPSEGGAMQFADSGRVLYLLPSTSKSGNQSESAANQVGTSFGSVPNNTGVLYYFTLTTAYDLSTASYQGYKRVRHFSYASFGVSGDGKWLINGAYNDANLVYYPIPTAFDITSINAANEVYINYLNYNGNTSTYGQIASSFIGANYYATSYNSNTILQLPWGPSYGSGTITTTANTNPQNIYNLAVTNTSGRIDSSSFVDINSMTAAQVAGSGTVNYAVSTDGRTTWSVAKGTDGVRPIVRNNSGTWQYNNDGGTSTLSLTSATNDNKNLSYGGTDQYMQKIHISDNGLNVILSGNSPQHLYYWQLSTAWDMSTASYVGSYNPTGTIGNNDISVLGFKSDGTKMYVGSYANKTIYGFNLSTAWDITTASADSNSVNISSYVTTPMGMFWKPDGTSFFVNQMDGGVFKYNLTTAWDVSTASYNSTYSPSSQFSSGMTLRFVVFKSDGTKMYLTNTNANYLGVYEYNLSTAWDITTASSTSNTFSYGSISNNAPAFWMKPDQTKLFLMDSQNSTARLMTFSTASSAYGTSVTWANGTVNDELYTLQQALGAQAFNRMDKTQLDAVADANHFPVGSGTSLDLMIALRVDALTTSVPTSDGVTLNYDAAALDEGAILGTDYDFFFPSSTKVQIKSLAAQNLKVRVV